MTILTVKRCDYYMMAHAQNVIGTSYDYVVVPLCTYTSDEHLHIGFSLVLNIWFLINFLV